MKPSKPPGQHKLEKDTAQFNAFVKLMRETVLGKLHLLGISGQGIERSFVTDIVASYPPNIALRLCSENIEDGMYFDSTHVKFYHTYNEEDTAMWVRKMAEERKLASAVMKSAEGK